MGFVTGEWLKTQFNNFATRISTVFAKKTEIPTKVGDLTNDSGFVTSAVDNLTNYYTKTAVDGLVSGMSANALVFDTKSALDEWIQDTNNTANLKAGQNIYIKETDAPDYWWDGTGLQPLETEKVNLDGYVTSDQLSTELAGYVSESDAETENIDFSGYFETEASTPTE